MSNLNSLDFLAYWWSIVKLFITIKLYIFCQWISQPSGKSKRKFFQKIAILGDEFALGFGDNLRLGGSTGISQTLSKEIARDNRIKQNWSIFNLGVYGSTTRDWLPAGFVQGVPNHPHLLESKLTCNSKLSGCKILGILIGFNDYSASPGLSPQTTLENIKSITKHLSDLGYKMYLFTIPPAFSKDSIFSTHENLERSQMIKELVSSGEIPNLHLGVEIDESNFEFKRKSLYSPGSSYFNATGYSRVAKDWFQMIVLDMVKQEFSVFKDILGY